eukprot:SAG25_NODE_702_length_5870_cov_4.999653_2_plen_267_part_00
MMHRAPQPLPAQKGLTNGVVLDCFAPTRSSAAAKAIARFAMATNEKSHAMQLPGGGRQSEELAGPAACRQIAKEGSGTATFFYLNSIIDWPFNFKLHGRMVDNPAWRLKVRPREPTPGRLPSVDTIVPPTLLALQIMPVICLPNCWGGAPSLVLTGTPPPSERQWQGHHAARPVLSTASSLPRSVLTLDRLRYAYYTLLRSADADTSGAGQVHVRPADPGSAGSVGGDLRRRGQGRLHGLLHRPGQPKRGRGCAVSAPFPSWNRSM